MNVHVPATLPNIDDIVAGHDRSLELYRAAFSKIEEAHKAIEEAYAEIERVTPGARFHEIRDADEVKDFHRAVRLPDRNAYLNTAAKLLTLRCWHYVVDRCGLQQLMDVQAKKEFDASLRYVPERPKDRRQVIDEEEIAKGPAPFTAENVRATIQAFSADAPMIWRRGIAKVFSSLDRRFRSHDGFKVGSRIILTYFLSDSSGSVNDYGDAAERFRDIERTFQILDGVDPRHAQSRFLHQVSEERRAAGFGWSKRGQSEHVSPYFKVRVFGNGNAHLWFTRDDLVEKVNKELAAYYGEVIGDGNTKEEDVFESRALTPARAFGFFPTHPELAKQIAEAVRYSERPLRILEPQAGTGNLANAIAEPFEVGHWDERKTIQHVVDAIEIQPKLASILRASGLLNSVTTADFLKVQPTPHKLYDGILMNPPFDRERDIDHVTHAMKFLKPCGWLVSIMSAGVEFRETRKAGAFRKLIADKKGWIVDLPAGSFSTVGTNVNTVLVGFGVSKPHIYKW